MLLVVVTHMLKFLQLVADIEKKIITEHCSYGLNTKIHQMLNKCAKGTNSLVMDDKPRHK